MSPGRPPLTYPAQICGAAGPERLTKTGISSVDATEPICRASEEYRTGYERWQEAYRLFGPWRFRWLRKDQRSAEEDRFTGTDWAPCGYPAEPIQPAQELMGGLPRVTSARVLKASGLGLLSARFSSGLGIQVCGKWSASTIDLSPKCHRTHRKQTPMV